MRLTPTRSPPWRSRLRKDCESSCALGAIIINPEPANLTGPEIAQLHIYDPMNQATRLMVWRPGEDTFAGRPWS